MEEKYANISQMVHFLIKNSYGGRRNLKFADLTCGNGYDTLFLSNLAGSTGFVKAFDIQEEAVIRTKKLLKENATFKNYEVIKESHEFIEKYLFEKIDAAVFNLGYLPNFDKRIITKPNSTIKCLSFLMGCLESDGRIYIAAYVSHDKGYEIGKISEYLNNIKGYEYNVIHIHVINKKSSPPELYIIEKNA